MLGDVVRGYRQTLGWSQEDLADRTGVSVRGIRKIEARETGIPRPATVRLLADAFALRGDERDRFCQTALTAPADPQPSELVRFAATPVGRVAYTVTGSGPPLLCMLGWISHLDVLGESPQHRRFVEALAREHTVIRYDKVGCGLSDRTAPEPTPASELAVVESLAEHLGLGRFALFGSCESGQVAATYAARNPAALSSLILYGSCARGADLASDAVKRSVLDLVRTHWGLGSRVLADIWFPDAPAEQTAWFARMQRAAATADTAAALLEMFYRTDVTALLPTIRVPTLVLHRRGSRAVRFELGRELATLIPGSTLAALDGRMQPIYAETTDLAAETLLSFLTNLK
ncbi:pimeloyl-ACP methyl ester carboxylesterase/DNA-binding XRE family transcriptional regulator [Actinoplanes tereljensis]|uniref:HTH cro/C1-type domain-containing protein n=1 Tax=Paractinoplanes tereljensis TaxID=571912 RepID=A0A919NSU5_9ACTN|nr:alpha/beta fold hydrolase [Actinoplanes tereljensis]GIF22917.1 hypothetical protein Ate02nite_56470 [Actinoplanes tereljensis]